MNPMIIFDISTSLYKWYIPLSVLILPAFGIIVLNYQKRGFLDSTKKLGEEEIRYWGLFTRKSGGMPIGFPLLIILIGVLIFGLVLFATAADYIQAKTAIQNESCKNVEGILREKKETDEDFVFKIGDSEYASEKNPFRHTLSRKYFYNPELIINKRIKISYLKDRILKIVVYSE
ncbi:MAG: hypothetical protein KAR21_04260 [Spirochaetales bacterium]|nr:hypothetical protein [Spirochaetales bacterium]